MIRDIRTYVSNIYAQTNREIAMVVGDRPRAIHNYLDSLFAHAHEGPIRRILN